LFYEGLIQNESFIKELNKGNWIIVPIPLSKTKLNKRGYNQAEILAKELAKKLDLEILNLLRREEGQVIGFKQRNMTEKNIFLIDDFTLTGLTLNTAAKP